MGLDISKLMAESFLFNYFVFGGFLPLLLFSIFWVIFPKRFVRRLNGEDNKVVKAELPIQLTILPAMIVIILSIFLYGYLWIVKDINIMLAVGLNFIYLFLSAFSMKFVVSKLEEFQEKLNRAKSKKKEEAMYLNKTYKFNLIQLTPVLILILVFLLSLINLTTFIEVIVLVVMYVVVYILQNIIMPNYLTLEYVYEVLPPTKDESIKKYEEYLSKKKTKEET